MKPSPGQKTRFPSAAALEVARELCARLKPVTVRLIVAGSLRRGKEMVGDVEIVFIPQTEPRREDFFQDTAANLAEEAIARMLEDGTLTKRPSCLGAHAWGPKNKLAVHVSGIPVDLFSTTRAAWWNYLVCRTGSAESNARIATAARERGFQWNPYREGFTCLKTGKMEPMNSEREVFEFAGLPYLEPWER